MPRNDAAAPGHVCPGIRIHAIDIVQPPGIGIPPIADMDAHQTIVTVALAAVEMQQPVLARAVPIAVGVVVLIAGALQFTALKAHHLTCCREAPGRGRTLPADAGTAWRHGLRLGLHCGHCCAGLMVVLLVIGVMDLRAMAVVAAAITVERLAPAGEWVARALGAVVVGAGLFLITRTAGLG